MAMQIVSTNENSSLDWRDQYKYIEESTMDAGTLAASLASVRHRNMLHLVEYYTATMTTSLPRISPLLRP